MIKGRNKKERETDRQTDTQRQRQTQTDRQTNRRTDGQTDRASLLVGWFLKLFALKYKHYWDEIRLCTTDG